MKSDNLDDGACCVFVIITYLLGLFINGNQWAGRYSICGYYIHSYVGSLRVRAMINGEKINPYGKHLKGDK